MRGMRKEANRLGLQFTYKLTWTPTEGFSRATLSTPEHFNIVMNKLL